MANTLTNLIPTLYAALDVVSRELVGMIPAVSRNSTAERVAVGQTVNIPVALPIVGADITPGQQPPDDGDAAPDNVTMTIQKSRYWPVRWSGEEELAVSESGLKDNFVTQQFAQALRAATNEIEGDLTGLHLYGSRAYGTAGTTPFGTAGDLSDLSFTKKVLEDNGAPMTDLKMVLGTAARANIGGKQSALFKVNEAGNDDLLRRGIIGRLEGFDIHGSGQTKTFTKGTGAAYTSSAAGFAIGATSIAIITGSGTVLAGDAITFAGDANIYLVKTGVAAPGTIVLQEPGLRQAIPASATALTILNTSARNMAFSQSAIQLATRMPALPKGGDSATDRMTITDPISGLTFEVSRYALYRRVKFEVAIAWGVKVIAPRHTAVLLG